MAVISILVVDNVPRQQLEMLRDHGPREALTCPALIIGRILAAGIVVLVGTERLLDLSRETAADLDQLATESTRSVNPCSLCARDAFPLENLADPRPSPSDEFPDLFRCQMLSRVPDHNLLCIDLFSRVHTPFLLDTVEWLTVWLFKRKGKH